MKNQNVTVRLQRLEQLSRHSYYGKLIKRLSEAEFDQVVEFIEDHPELDAGEFERAVNRMHLEGNGYKRTKNYSIVEDVLLCCRATTAETEPVS